MRTTPPRVRRPSSDHKRLLKSKICLRDWKKLDKWRLFRCRIIYRLAEITGRYTGHLFEHPPEMLTIAETTHAGDGIDFERSGIGSFHQTGGLVDAEPVDELGEAVTGGKLNHLREFPRGNAQLVGNIL